MSTLCIFKSANVKAVEDHLIDLQKQVARNLQIPVKLHKDSIGGEAALIQLIITWARRHPDGNLVSHVQRDEDPSIQLKHLMSTGFGFVACLMCNEILTSDSEAPISQSAYEFASSRVDQMWLGPQQALHGHRILLASVDHSTKSRLPPFYFSDGTVRGRKEFCHLADLLVTAGATTIAPDASRDWLANLPRSTFDQLGAILHELVKNTHEWARTSVSGVPLRKSVRGILVTFRNLDLATIQNAAQGSQPLEQFIGHGALVGADGRFRCLEISIFDSGPGLASRWLNRSLDEDVAPADEYNACLECLQKHRTTSGRSHKGIGLYEVVRTLSPLQGFLRLRTGRLALYRDFVEQPLTEGEHEGTSGLGDWSTGSSEVTHHAPVEGTLFTMLIPLTFGGV